MAFIPVVLVAGACQVARSQTSHISSSRAKPLPRPRKRCRRSVPVMSLEDPNTDDFEDDVDTDDVISRRVFNAGITVSGLLALINGINLFGGDEFKEDLAAPFRQALPFLFSKSGDEGAERSKLNREFATYFFEQHAVVADRIGIISREALEEEEAALLERSKHLFFPDTGPGDNLSLYDNLKMYNYKLYARVHSIAVRTSPASRLQFSRVLGKDLLTKVLAGRTLPQPVEVRRDPRNEGAISEWMMVCIPDKPHPVSPTRSSSQHADGPQFLFLSPAVFHDIGATDCSWCFGSHGMDFWIFFGGVR